MHRLFFLALFSFVGLCCTAQSKINWLTWEEATKLQEENPKKIFIDMYTEWCGWCKKMDKTTFSDPAIIQEINQNYYPVKFDAEYKEDLVYKNKDYAFIKNGKKGYHELAAKLTRGRLSFPTTIFLDEDLNVIQSIPGYQDAPTLDMIMNYFSGNHFKDTPWKKFTNSFKAGNPILPKPVPVKN